ncbi:MAG: DUF1801 domain-containing protein [Candidatus Saccharimonadales bacterium]
MSVIDEYLQHIAAPQRDALERIRTIVKRLAPDAEEVIGYGMPVFKYNKKYVIGFAAFKNHMSIFPGSEPIADIKNELKTFHTSKGTIQFTVDNPLPESLIEKIIAHSLQNAAKK